MKQRVSFFLVLILFLVSGCKSTDDNTINPIIGDISFVRKFGFLPNADTDNHVRIQAHLEYVEDLLRKKDNSHLNAALKKKREKALDLLRDYATAGIFPKNYDYSNQRKPCFIDRDNVICAVGYLVEKTAGRDVAEQINQKHKYHEILEMQDQTVDNWITSSGLSEEECAMIQPTYGPNQVATQTVVKPPYAVASSILIGGSVALNTINTIYIAKGAGGKTAPVLGLLAGASQIVIGSVGLRTQEEDYVLDYGSSGQRTLSMINIGMGTTTMLLSTWNLARQKKAVSRRTSWNVFGFPDKNKAGFGLSFAKKI